MSQGSFASPDPLNALHFIQSSPVSLFSATLAGQMLMVNASMAHLMCYDSPQDMMDKVVNTHDLWVEPEKLKEIIAENKSRNFTAEAWVIRKNGERICVALQACIMPATESMPARMEGAIFDLSARQHKEVDIAQSEERFRMLSEQSLMGISILQNQRIVYANQAMALINGRSVEEMKAWHTIPFKELIHPDDLGFAISQAQKKQMGDPNVVTHYAYRLQLPDGTLRWVDQYSKTIQYDGQPADLVMQLDINHLKRAEKTIEAEHERLAVTLRSIADGVIATDNAGKIRVMSLVAEKMTGWTQDEAMGLPFAEVFHTIHEGSRQIASNPIERVLKTGDIVEFDNLTLLISRDGTEHRITKSGSPIRDSLGETQGVVLVFRDTTEKEKLFRTTQHAQKLESLGVLAGGIAHDFNNLLGSIFGYADLAHERTQDSKIKEYLHKVLVNLDKARGLTSQLLTFSKGGEPMRRLMPLMPYLKDTVDHALNGSMVKCEWDIPANLPACPMDPNQIAQVIYNVVINAVQSMPQGGTLWIKADTIHFRKRMHASIKPGKFIRIGFRDEGMGIATQILPHIFDPFFTTKSSGSGLGLAMCYSIMKRHDGAIDVESKVGGGSTFTLWIPVVASAKEERTQIKVQSQPSLGHIYVMDDDPNLRELTSEMLTQSGYRVTIFTEGKSLVEAFNHSQVKGDPPTGIILDLTIPGQLGGIETVRQIRELKGALPIFVASGYSADPVMTNPQAFGFTDCLRKPFFKSELLAQLEKHLEKHLEMKPLSPKPT